VRGQKVNGRLKTSDLFFQSRIKFNLRIGCTRQLL
jgi:hypothetical protein